MLQSQPIAAPAEAQNATLFVAFELGKKNWLVGLHATALGRGLSRHKVAGGDLAKVLELIAQARSRLEKQGYRVRVLSIYEAGYDGPWLHRALLAAGIDNRMIDPASVPVDRRARRVKTDRLDLDRLLDELMALERGDFRRGCRVVRVPSAEEEDAKEQHRQRSFLVKQRTALVNRMTGLLMARGIRDLSPRRPDFLERLAPATTGEGHALLPGLKQALALDYERLQLVERQIAAIEAAQARAVKRAGRRKPVNATERTAEMTARLARLRGIAAVSGLVLCREVFYRPFENRRQVGSYFGFPPTPYQSGNLRIEQGISRAGNARARAMAVELALLWLRHQPDSALSRWFRARTEGRSTRVRRIAVVALARKLMVALWRYLTTGLVPEGAVMKPA
jgi:transposase